MSEEQEEAIRIIHEIFDGGAHLSWSALECRLGYCKCPDCPNSGKFHTPLRYAQIIQAILPLATVGLIKYDNQDRLYIVKNF